MNILFIFWIHTVASMLCLFQMCQLVVYISQYMKLCCLKLQSTKTKRDQFMKILGLWYFMHA